MHYFEIRDPRRVMFSLYIPFFVSIRQLYQLFVPGRTSYHYKYNFVYSNFTFQHSCQPDDIAGNPADVTPYHNHIKINSYHPRYYVPMLSSVLSHFLCPYINCTSYLIYLEELVTSIRKNLIIYVSFSTTLTIGMTLLATPASGTPRHNHIKTTPMILTTSWQLLRLSKVNR